MFKTKLFKSSSKGKGLDDEKSKTPTVGNSRSPSEDGVSPCFNTLVSNVSTSCKSDGLVNIIHRRQKPCCPICLQFSLHRDAHEEGGLTCNDEAMWAEIRV